MQDLANKQMQYMIKTYIQEVGGTTFYFFNYFFLIKSKAQAI